MCQVYVGTDPKLYECSSRSIRMEGFVTSIRLENEFWKILDEMARSESQTTPQFLNRLREELLANHGEINNFTSFLRVACSVYVARGGVRADSMSQGAGEEAMEFTH